MTAPFIPPHHLARIVPGHADEPREAEGCTDASWPMVALLFVVLVIVPLVIGGLVEGLL